MSIIYCAGLFDGEGTVTLGRSSNPNAFRRVEVSLSSTDKILCQKMTETFGVGFIRFRPRAKKHHKDAYEYRVSGPSAIKVLRILRPHILCPMKIARAEFILDNFESLTKKNGKYTDEERTAKEQFEKKFFQIAVETS